MSQIVAEGQGTGDPEVDGLRTDASSALEQYLNRPVRSGTFSFWKEYSQTTDYAQKCLCKVARLFLTPPPTSTGKLLMSYAFHLPCQNTFVWHGKDTYHFGNHI